MSEDHELTYFEMQMLLMEIEMNSMIWENEHAKQNGNTIPYCEKAFDKLPEKFGVHHNAFPFYKG